MELSGSVRHLNSASLTINCNKLVWAYPPHGLFAYAHSPNYAAQRNTKLTVLCKDFAKIKLSEPTHTASNLGDLTIQIECLPRIPRLKRLYLPSMSKRLPKWHPHQFLELSFFI